VTTNDTKIPEWSIDVNKVYPNDRYIAQRGYGVDHQSAQMDSLETISRYFSTHIETKMQEVIMITDERSSGILKNETFIKSQTNLFAVNYTEPWYNRSTEKWEVVAYINRIEAWTIYEPELRRKADTFNTMYKEAERQDEHFMKILFYSNANDLSIKEELLENLAFANILYPPGASFFDDTLICLSKIPSRIEGLKPLITLYIDCETDFDNSIYTVISTIFASQGFPVTKEEMQAAYFCKVSVNENEQILTAGVFYYPAINIYISNRNKVIFSYSRALNRSGASNEDIARRRTYDAISNEIQNSFLLEIRKGFE
jgi:hypothetical protein